MINNKESSEVPLILGIINLCDLSAIYLWPNSRIKITLIKEYKPYRDFMLSYFFNKIDITNNDP